jgi:hypothetical protein
MIGLKDISFTITLNHKQFTITHNPSYKTIFTSGYFVTDLNNGDSPASMVTPFPSG